MRSIVGHDRSLLAGEARASPVKAAVGGGIFGEVGPQALDRDVLAHDEFLGVPPARSGAPAADRCPGHQYE